MPRHQQEKPVNLFQFFKNENEGRVCGLLLFFSCKATG